MASGARGQVIRPSDSAKSCMQAPDTCKSLSFVSSANGLCSAVVLEVRIGSFQSGASISLPSANVSVTAGLLDRYLPYDAGAEEETLTLIGGNVVVALSLNNFDVHFDLVFTRPNGDQVTIEDGRAALLDAQWKDDTFCN
jgi:hypothetical protein